MTDDQLLTKTVFFPSIPQFVVGDPIRTVKFHLQRGKIARVQGFCMWWIIQTLDINEPHILHVMKAAVKNRLTVASPSMLWASSMSGGGIVSESFKLPEAFRCNRLSVDAFALAANASSGQLIIYYTIDDMRTGESTQVLESSRQKGRSLA